MHSLKSLIDFENYKSHLQNNEKQNPTMSSNSYEPKNICPVEFTLYKKIKTFKKHALEDLNDANLMNRVDTKFVINKAHLHSFLDVLEKNYSVLSINGREIFDYQNQYFDTEDMAFYNSHHNGKLNRYKVRLRHYVDSQLKFLEVKFKNNKKRTIKSRINLANADEKSINHFISKQLGDEKINLETSQISGYRRIAFANIEAAERITVDFNIWYQSVNTQEIIKLKNVCVIEVKQFKKNIRTCLFSLAKKLGYSSVSFSKYCIGCALLYSNTVKTNRFKKTINKYFHNQIL